MEFFEVDLQGNFGRSNSNLFLIPPLKSTNRL